MFRFNNALELAIILNGAIAVATLTYYCGASLIANP